jgi:hypothetical protein
VSFGDYVTGVIGLAAVAGPLALAAVRLRSLWLPGWDRAPARLAEAVLGVSILTIVLQLLGAVGLFEPWAIVVAALAVGGAAAVWLPREAAEGEPPPSPAIPPLHAAIALAAAAFLAAHWATGLQDFWARGMLTFDTLWYHGPFAARIAETGSVWGLHFTDPLYLNWFYPENSELLHGAGIALLDRDLFSPLVNFGWLGVALLAGWCIGRPYGVAPLSLVAVALVLDTGPMIPREAGTPATDIAPVALLLAAAAFLINVWASRGGEADAPEAGGRRPALDLSWGRPWATALLLAGLAMGLALGTRLTISGAVAAMAVGVPLVMPPGARRRALLIFLGGIAATAGFWFLRNLIHSGNPLPFFGEAGPIDLPGPGRGLEGRDDYSVAHYILEDPDTDIWSGVFLKAITNLFGPVWFLFFGLAALGALLAVIRPRSPAIRLMGAVAIAGAIAYLFTPLTAAGPEGDPRAFGINLRYLAPALALALALLAVEPRLTPERFRLPLLGGGVLALLITSLYSDSAFIWDEPFTSKPVAALIGIVLIGAPVGLALLARRRLALAAGAAAVLALAVAAVGWARQDNYFEDRYTRAEDFRFQLDDVGRWAKPTEGLRIGVAGLSGAYNQYIAYGDRLSNHVQYIGRELGSGDFRAATTCPEFVRAANAGEYDYVVTTPELDLNDPATAKVSPEGGWMRAAGGEEILREGRVAIFRVGGDLDESACGKGGPVPSETSQ